MNGGVGLKEWGIGRMDPCWRLGAVYYVRAWTANQVTKPQKFSIVFRLARVQGTYLYKGKTTHYQTREELPSIAYYMINIPKEEFVDYQ